MNNRLLKLFISLFFCIIYFTVLNICKLIRIPFPGTFVVLMYHSVKDSQYSAFGKHLKIVLKSGQPVRADFEGPMSNYKHYISVTFDDGYQNFIKNVLPEIQKHRIPTALFIPTGNLGRKPDWVTDPNYDYVDETILTEEQLQQLPLDLITIGSHSVSHPHLAQVNKEIVEKELLDSKKKLEEIFHQEITLLSLPYGSYNREVLMLSKRIGYKRIFLNIPSFPSSKLKDYMIGRIDISPNDWPIEYRMKILGAYQWLPLAVAVKRRLRKLFNLIRETK